MSESTCLTGGCRVPGPAPPSVGDPYCGLVQGDWADVPAEGGDFAVAVCSGGVGADDACEPASSAKPILLAAKREPSAPATEHEPVTEREPAPAEHTQLGISPRVL